MTMAEKQLKKSPYKKIALIIGLVFLAGLSFQLAKMYLGSEKSLESSSLPAISASADRVSAAQITAVAKNFACACEGCGELPLAQCNCDMPRGALEEKKFIREKLAEGNTVERVIDLLERQYGHRT
jgi:cytochrome c-type biogenesis protein CcmH/NrfF